jgi:hypothetical protein
MKLGDRKDRELKSVIPEGDWTFGTRNSVDFPEPVSSHHGIKESMSRKGDCIEPVRGSQANMR